MAESFGGIAGWLIARLRGRRHAQPRLALLERIALAPRQSLALVEAEGRKILVATSAEGGPAFYPLDEGRGMDAGARTRTGEIGARRGALRPIDRRPRVSW